MRRRVRIPAVQWVGVPLILLLPLLAVLGVFGTRRTVVRARGAVEVRVAYPTGARYDFLTGMAVTVRNRSPLRLDTVRVAFDRAYITAFSQVSFIPAVDQAFVTSLTDVAPGESRLITVEMWGDRAGPHAGTVVAAAGRDTVVAPLRTFTFP